MYNDSVDDLSHLAGSVHIDLDQLRDRLRRMDDADLIRFGRAAKFMTSPEVNIGKDPRLEFVIQLEEAREEWVRRKWPRSPDF